MRNLHNESFRRFSNGQRLSFVRWRIKSAIFNEVQTKVEFTVKDCSNPNGFKCCGYIVDNKKKNIRTTQKNIHPFDGFNETSFQNAEMKLAKQVFWAQQNFPLKWKHEKDVIENRKQIDKYGQLQRRKPNWGFLKGQKFINHS